jgi:hypothetical protein
MMVKVISAREVKMKPPRHRPSTAEDIENKGGIK